MKGHVAMAFVLVLVALGVELMAFVLVVWLLLNQELCCKCAFLCRLCHRLLDLCLIFELVLLLNILVHSDGSI